MCFICCSNFMKLITIYFGKLITIYDKQYLCAIHFCCFT